MTALTADLGPSWLRSLPDGAVVLRRDVDEFVVAAVATEHFSARRPGERSRQWFPLLLVADADRALLAVGAKFWWVREWTGPGCVTDAIRFRRLGVTAEQAFRGGEVA